MTPTSEERVHLLVVGGGPAGLEAARAYRSAGGAGRVLIVSQDCHAPYARPPLTKDHLRGRSSTTALPLVEDSFYADHEIELRLGRTAVALDPGESVVRTFGGGRFRYDACVLATGSHPTAVPVPGAHDPRVHQLRSLDDGVAVRDAAAHAGSAVVVGSGFIGCEAVASLRARGVACTLVTMEDAPQQDRLGDEVAARIARWLADDGVRLVTGAEVRSIVDARPS